MKRLAVEQLGSIPSGLYTPIEHALNESAIRAGTPGARRTELASLLTLRQHSATYVMRFRQQVAQGFDDFRALRIRHRGDLPMGLVAENQLEFHLSGQRLAEAIDQRYSRPLEMMEGRLEALANALDVPHISNPIGASRLAGAFIETFRDAELSESLRPMMFRQYEQELARVLGDLYGRVNTLLATAGYGMVETSSRPKQAPATPAPAAPEDRTAASDAQILAEFNQLRDMLHVWREGLVQGEPLTAENAPQRTLPPRRELRVDEVVSVASLLQSEPPDVFARALAGSGLLGDAIRDHLSDGARRLGINPDQTRLSVAEEDAIDLVAMLFESLFRTHSLLDRARRLYARLVLPYVKVALTDHSLFASREHPARRLLDAITEACEGNSAATPQDRELLERAAAVAQRIVADYNEDLAIFELAHTELDALLTQQRRRVELQEERAAKAAFGRERLSDARARADEIVNHRLRAQPLTQAVGDFLSTPWRHHLVQTLLREGQDAERHAEALMLGDALVVVDEFASDNRGRAVADRLVTLQSAIVQCLASSGLDDSASEHGLAGLVHSLAWPDVTRRVHQLMPVNTPHEDEAGEERRLWLAGGTATIAHDPALAERMRRLLPGEWVRITDAQGEAIAAKVAWVSPLTSRMLLVNRRGIRVLVASAEELAALAAQGRVSVEAERTPFDEAMRQVRHRLGRVAGRC
ncbi:DUF1631 family protein [Lysobacter niastensis]|uniref:DUF1631 family protein n=2 Tax=Lysobacter niastensis TaxID=380629 RepID=A0ABS0BFR7_9GAMM|nr:DUF1631 family protein [Lysobacter niastensis]